MFNQPKATYTKVEAPLAPNGFFELRPSKYKELAPCLVCQKGTVYSREPSSLELTKTDWSDEWGTCDYCGAIGNEIIDGFFYPVSSLAFLCKNYKFIKDLIASDYVKNDTLTLITKDNSFFNAKVQHVYSNKLIIQNSETNEVLFVTDKARIEDAFIDLTVENKVKYGSWPENELVIVDKLFTQNIYN